MVPSRFSDRGGIRLKKRSSWCTFRQLIRYDDNILASISDVPIAPVMDKITETSKVDLSTLTQKFHNERAAFVEVVNVMSTYCATIVLNQMEYKQDIDSIKKSNVTLGHLGMGLAETWRGAPDARLRGFCTDSDKGDVAVLGAKRSLKSDSSDGTTTICEAKLEISSNDIFQLVKMCVVAAFVENNQHPSLNPMIPAILIDTSHARVALYCVQQDILLICNTFSWRNGNNMDVAGFSLLWIMINHRYEVKVMHRYGILPIIQLTNIVIQILADTDNRSDVYVS